MAGWQDGRMAGWQGSGRILNTYAVGRKEGYNNNGMNEMECMRCAVLCCAMLCYAMLKLNNGYTHTHTHTHTHTK
jgi:hypothetical protein